MNYLTRWQRPGLAWPTFGRLNDLQEEIERLFETPLAAWSPSANLLSGWTPALDVYEDKDNLYVKLEVPGMKKEDLEISLHEGNLSVTGERKNATREQDAEVYRAERFFGRFQRTISLPSPVAADKVKATYQDGVLTVTLPKTEEAKPRHIDVSVN